MSMQANVTTPCTCMAAVAMLASHASSQPAVHATATVLKAQAATKRRKSMFCCPSQPQLLRRIRVASLLCVLPLSVASVAHQVLAPRTSQCPPRSRRRACMNRPPLSSLSLHKEDGNRRGLVARLRGQLLAAGCHVHQDALRQAERAVCASYPRTRRQSIC